jgi:hypothetical protein
MSTLTTSISIASNTLFPAPVNFTKTVNESVDGYHNSFQQVSIGSAAEVILYDSQSAAGNSGVVYFYAESIAENVTNISIQIQYSDNDPLFFARLIPGDILYLPLWALHYDGIKVTAINDAGLPASLSFFVGEKE